MHINTHTHTHTTRNAPGVRGSTPETPPILAKNWEGSQAGTRTKPPIYQLAFLVFLPKRKILKSTTHHPEFIKSDKNLASPSSCKFQTGLRKLTAVSLHPNTSTRAGSYGSSIV